MEKKVLLSTANSIEKLKNSSIQTFKIKQLSMGQSSTFSQANGSIVILTDNQK